MKVEMSEVLEVCEQAIARLLWIKKMFSIESFYSIRELKKVITQMREARRHER